MIHQVAFHCKHCPETGISFHLTLLCTLSLRQSAKAGTPESSWNSCIPLSHTTHLERPRSNSYFQDFINSSIHKTGLLLRYRTPLALDSKSHPWGLVKYTEMARNWKIWNLAFVLFNTVEKAGVPCSLYKPNGTKKRVAPDTWLKSLMQTFFALGHDLLLDAHHPMHWPTWTVTIYVPWAPHRDSRECANWQEGCGERRQSLPERLDSWLVFQWLVQLVNGTSCNLGFIKQKSLQQIEFWWLLHGKCGRVHFASCSPCYRRRKLLNANRGEVLSTRCELVTRNPVQTRANIWSYFMYQRVATKNFSDLQGNWVPNGVRSLQAEEITQKPRNSQSFRA